MKLFRVIDSGSYWGCKEVEAETEDEAREKYINDPLSPEDYDYDQISLEIEEVEDVKQDDQQGVCSEE